MKKRTGKNGRFARGTSPTPIEKAKKDNQINLRLSAVERAVIEAAAAVVGETKSDFILRRAFKDAKKILQARGYKISSTHPTFRGIDKEMAPHRRYSSLAPVGSLDLVSLKTDAPNSLPVHRQGDRKSDDPFALHPDKVK